MKRKGILGMAVVAVIGLSGCGQKELSLVSDQIEVELGSKIDETVTTYVELDADAAEQASVDFSAVDVMKVGTYVATVTCGKQTANFEVVVEDTTAPKVRINNPMIIAVGEPLYAKDIIAGITELSGKVIVSFEEVEETKEVSVEGTENNYEDMEDVTEDSVILDGITYNNAFLTYTEVGAYENRMTISDVSGNTKEVLVPIIVGEPPMFEGIKDMTVVEGTKNVSYLDGIKATSSFGVDVTEQIICDSSAVNLDKEGTYSIIYTVKDQYGFQAEAKASVMVEKAGSSKKTTAGVDGSTKKSSASGDSNKSSGNSSTTNTNTTSGSSATPNTGGSSSGTSGGNNSTSGGSSPEPNTNTTNNNTSGGNADANSGTSGGSVDTSGNASTPNAGTDGNSGTVDENQAMQDQLENGGFEEYVPEPGTGADDGSGMEGATGIR